MHDYVVADVSKCPVFFLGYFQTFMSATHNTRRGMAVAGKGRALPPKGGGSLWRHLMMCVWLGHLHVAVAVFALAVYKLPHPLAVAVLAAYVTATLAPNRPPYPRWGIAIARAITNAAMGCFPCTMEWEDEPGYLAAAARVVHTSSAWNHTRCYPSPSSPSASTSSTPRPPPSASETLARLPPRPSS